jgi:hypothetical protein
MKLPVARKSGNLSSREANIFSRRTLLHAFSQLLVASLSIQQIEAFKLTAGLLHFPELISGLVTACV